MKIIRKISGCFCAALCVLIACVTVSAASGLSAPAVSVKKSGDTAVISWGAVEGATHYAVYRKIGTSGEFAQVKTTAKTTYTDTDVQKNRVYFYVVRGYEISDGEITKKSSLSGEVSYLHNATKVKNLVCFDSGPRVELTWEKHGSADYYEVLRKSDDDNSKFKTLAKTRGISYTDTSALPEKSYTYAVRPVKQVGDSTGTADYAGQAVTKNLTTLPENSTDNEWAYFLINGDNPLPKNYIENVTLAKVQGEFLLDARAAVYARRMISAAKKDGIKLVVSSSYRSSEKQAKNINEYIKFLKAKGYSHEDAVVQTYKEIAKPGTSEHNAGLALDIINAEWWETHDDLTADFENTKEFAWLAKNAHKFGFILRYPKDKVAITAYDYEAWHYRFVGIAKATEMKKSGLCLEEDFTKNIKNATTL